MNKITLSIAAVFAAAAVGCGDTTVSVNNANTRNANVNMNANVNANADRDRARIDWANTNISREEYDERRADYERDRGDSTIGSGVNDSWIWFKTRAALMTADDLRESTINVDVVDEKITLRGTVGSAAQKAEAERVAKSIEGQKGVTNQLTVRAGDSITNQMVNGNSNSNR